MVSLKFHCNSLDGTTIEITTNGQTNTLYIEVCNSESEVLSNMVLDKTTAIKLSKELRKQIALLD